MNKIIVDAMGDTCPIPVVKTKNAIKELKESGTVEVFVDNEIAVQNLTKMAQVTGYPVSASKLEDNKYSVLMEVSVETDEATEKTGEKTDDEAQAVTCRPDIRGNNRVIVISSNQMGAGSEELGKTLLKGFLYAVTQQDELPRTILFYNSGVYMTCEESPALDDLKSLEAQGVTIMSCGTCLNYYGVTEKLKVGSVTNMYDIVETMEKADLLIKPC
ncbi:MAG: sulfurtransferase-like selenium metabolism protein YedF [Eubacterium sp.]|nr:sulfurtransferase-like selenium metabolism protein YedF [Eubacterium sp.]